MIQKRKSSVEKFVVATEKPRTMRFVIAAFLAGALATWAGSQFFAPPPAVRPAPTSGVPDVSALPPGQAAATLGNYEYDHANWTAAAQQYERAIAAGFDSPDLRTDLGTAYRYLGDADKALAQYGIAQRKDPFHQNSLFNEAVVYAELLHDAPRATAAAREYLRRFPQGRGADSARTMIRELDAENGGVEKRLTELLTKPKPVRAQP